MRLKIQQILTIVFILGLYVIPVNAGNDLKSTDKKAKQKNLIIIIDNLESSNAPIFITLYTQKNEFLSEKDAYKFYKFIPKGKQLIVKLKEIGYGEYAIATYQDLNSDNLCNRSFIGIPKEPYAFSNNYIPRVRAPNFDDCKFLFDKNANSIKINMIK